MEIVINQIKCVDCGDILETPVLLPCGKSICKKHTDECNYTCFFCEKTHCGIFYFNEALDKIIRTNIHRLSLGLNHEQAVKCVRQLGDTVQELNLLLTEPTFFIHDVIAKLKNQTDLIREQHKCQIENKHRQIISALDEYMSPTSRFSNKNEQVVNRTDELYLSKQQILVTFNAFEMLMNDFCKQITLKHNTNLNIDKWMRCFDSKILVSDMEQTLLDICGFSRSQRFRLVYRASEQGFRAVDFHSRCDRVSNTLTLVKSTNGNVFGGFTNKPWTNVNRYESDERAFIFSLISQNNSRPIKINVDQMRPSWAIYCGRNSGPTFGRGHDLHISDNSNVKKESFSNLGYSFEHPDYWYNSVDAKRFLAGSFYFLVEEIEVFEVV